MKKRKQKKKNPWVAATLNFFVWGLGYVYIRKKVPFGIGLIIINVFGFSWLMFSLSDIPLAFWAVTVALGFVFANNAYDEAKN